MPQNSTRTSLISILVLLEWVVVICVAGGLLLGLLFQTYRLAKPTAPGAILDKTSGAHPGSDGARATATLTANPSPTAGFTVEVIPQSPLPSLPPPPTATPRGLQGKIVYTCTPEKYNQLCMMNADGSNQVRLTSRKANDYYPSLAPDGKSVVFVSNQTGLFEIYLLNLDSGEERRVTDGIGNVSAPDVSGDDQWIVFASKMGGDSSIWKIRSDGSLPRPLTDTQWNEIDPTWSPNSERIAFAGVQGGYVELFVMDAAGGDAHQITHDVLRIGGRNSWSPDGKRLAFYAGPRGDRDIYVVEIATGQVVRLTHGGNNAGPCYSPDGNWIAFSSSRDGDHEIYVMRANGSEVIQFTDNTYDDWQPRWGP